MATGIILDEDDDGISTAACTDIHQNFYLRYSDKLYHVSDPVAERLQALPLEEDSLIRKRKLEDLLRTTQVALLQTGTRKSIKLARTNQPNAVFSVIPPNQLRRHTSFRSLSQKKEQLLESQIQEVGLLKS
jgi:hypothetical protein